GTVRLRSNKPTDPPVITTDYLATENDLQVLEYATQLGRELVGSKLLDPMRGNELAPGPDVKTKDQIREWVRNTAVTVWHPSCSCRMGTDEMAVVDPELRVRGIEGLRIVDCSVMP